MRRRTRGVRCVSIGNRRVGAQLAQLPTELTDRAANSIGGAQQLSDVIRGLPFPGAGVAADAISNGAADAFVTGFHQAVLLGAAATAIAFVVVVVFLPARARASDAELQAMEYQLEHADAAPPRPAAAVHGDGQGDGQRDGKGDGQGDTDIVIAPAPATD